MASCFRIVAYSVLAGTLSGAMRINGNPTYPKCFIEKFPRTTRGVQQFPRILEFPRIQHGAPEGEEEKVLIFRDATATKYGAVRDSGGHQVDLKCHGCGGCGIPEDEVGCDHHTEIVVVLQSGNAQMYYHFVAEIMMRLAYVLDQHPEYVTDKTMYQTRNMDSGFPTEWARMFGINHNGLTSSCWNAKTVVWPPTIGCCRTRPVPAKLMRSFLHERYFPGQIASQPLVRPRPQALIIQRCQRKNRRITNFDEIVDGMLGLGYDVVVHSDLDLPSVEDQCKMFFEADVVLGPHGAGLVNMVCCKPGTPIIEIQTRPPHHNTAFQSLSGNLGLPYYEVQTNDPYTFEYMNQGDVNITAVLEAAEEVKTTLRT